MNARILGIETTCDETSFAIVEDGQKVLYMTTISQAKKHSQFGGVVPELAAREHIINIETMFSDVLDKALKYKPTHIAVASEIGLPPAVKTGESFALGASVFSGLPLIEVNHVIAHIWGVWLDDSFKQKPQFPLLGVILSGGHSMVLRFESPTKYKVLVQTLDDAIGEVFDKVARHMGLEYPGGPEIERRAQQGDEYAIDLPTPLQSEDRLAFSFSGLKTSTTKAYDYYMTNSFDLYKEFVVNDIAASFQRVAFEHVAQKVTKIIKDTGLTQVVLGGGVTANHRLVDILGREVSKLGASLYVPSLKYTGDNGALVAGYAYNLI